MHDESQYRVQVEGNDVLLFHGTPDGKLHLRVLLMMEWQSRLARLSRGSSGDPERDAAREAFEEDLVAP